MSNVPGGNPFEKVRDAHRISLLRGSEMRDFGCVIRTDHTVGMVTDYVMKKTTTCSPIVGQFFDTMFVALSDKEWL